MWLNSTAQTALRAVLHIAEHATEAPVRVDDIANAISCPRNYLSKTLHSLVQAGVLRSARGPKGGFQLVDSPEQLSLRRVVRSFQPAAEKRCLMGRATCGDAHPCFAHARWSAVAAQVEDFFGQTTVADLLRQDARSRAT